MICGALQTLNEEACEDVLEETEDPANPEADIPHTSVIPPSPDTVPGECHRKRRSGTHVEPNVTILNPQRLQGLADIP